MLVLFDGNLGMFLKHIVSNENVVEKQLKRVHNICFYSSFIEIIPNCHQISSLISNPGIEVCAVGNVIRLML